ncbi:MAG: CsbD family protein [Pirellulales bacterium]
MNWDTIQGKWQEMKGQVKQKWGKLTDDDVDVINGKRDELAGRIQQRYGVAKEEAERQVNDFERSCSNL